jgi:hypothetical protein
MFKTYIKRSKCIELIDEQTDEEGLTHKIQFRVLDPQMWGAILVDLLQFAEDEEEYVISIRKEYLLVEGKPSFMWVFLVWGDIVSAALDLGPILHSVVQTETPIKLEKAEKPVPENPSRRILGVQKFQTDEGIRMAKRVRLPFSRGRRDNPGASVTKKFGDRRKGAYVDSGFTSPSGASS